MKCLRKKYRNVTRGENIGKYPGRKKLANDMWWKNYKNVNLIGQSIYKKGKIQ
jgi:hypothetical protein